ncbi:MAG: hypothetical protein A3K10_13900 [Bacteroidetes bacterium RIFCSPLOWO2_12_FULL_31_6]|nr:MAG: hypothetical protein A3K10_13900 [Bacteroidetes bacterium RIFCSPLOWO2_12_FULL_31_6]
MIRTFFLIPIICCLFFLVSKSQESSFQLNKFILSNGSSVQTDNIGSIYGISSHEIVKYKSNGDVQYTYSDKSAGDITCVDVNNPFNVLVFYKDFHQILFLDNTLSAISEPFALAEHELDQVSLTCTSRDNGIWLYDQQKFQLFRMDKNFKIILQSGYINQLLGQEIHPSFMLEYNNQLYLNDTTIGILIFDIYGAYYKTIPFKEIKEFQVVGDRLYYLLGSVLKSYNMKTLEEQEIKLPEPSVQSIRIEGNIIYLLSNGHITIYTLLN